MPDMSHQRERVDEFERYAAVPGGRKGGVFLARNKKSCIVNIRPRRWSDKNKFSKFWKGRIPSLGLAKFFADTIFYYCGKPRYHFGNTPFHFPPLDCMGTNANPTPEQRSRYVQGIAGKDFWCERNAFIQQVMDVIESQEFILQGERFLRNVQVAVHPPPPITDEAAPDNPSPTDAAAPDNPSPTGEAAAAASSPTDEVAADNSSPTAEAGGDEECEAPFEDDFEAAAMVRGLAAPSQGASFASFGLNIGKFDANRRGKILESVEQRLGQECYSLKGWSPDDEKDWNMATEDLNKKNAMTVPNGPIPQPIFANVSFLPGTNFVEVEHVVSSDISEEKQLAIITPHGQSHIPLSCQPSIDAAFLVQSCELNYPSAMSSTDMALSIDDCLASIFSAESLGNTASLMQSCELNNSSVMSLASMAFSTDDCFASIWNVESEAQLNSTKRQKTQD